MALFYQAGYEKGDELLSYFPVIAGGGGSIAVDAAFAKTGTKSLKLVLASASARYGQINETSGKSVLVFSGQVYVDTLPVSLNRELLRLRYASAVRNCSVTVDSAGLLTAKLGPSGTEGTQAGATISAGTWNLIEIKLDAGASPATMDWRVNGADQTDPPTVSGGVSTSETRIGGSDATAATATFRWDDVNLADNTADYPLGWIPIVEQVNAPGRTMVVI